MSHSSPKTAINSIRNRMDKITIQPTSPLPSTSKEKSKKSKKKSKAKLIDSMPFLSTSSEENKEANEKSESTNSPAPLPSTGSKKNKKANEKLKAASIDSKPPLQSTSSQENKEANEKSKSTSSDSQPPLLALATDGDNALRKLIQLSPISQCKKSFSTLKQENLKSIPEKLGLELNALALDESKVLRVNAKYLRNTHQIQLIPDNQPSEQAQEGSTASSTNTPVSSTTVSSIINTNIPASQVSEKTKYIPNILQKKALLYQVTPSKPIPKTDSQASKIEKMPSNNIKEQSSTSHESNKKEEKTQEKACKIQQVQSKSKNAKATMPKKNKKMEEGQKKNSPINKSKSSRKKRKKSTNDDKDASKDEVASLYVAEGFREDVECLVEKCLQVSKLNMKKFIDVFKAMDFACIFHGRKSGAELAELSEEVIHIAKSYFLAPNINLEENVAGLLLVYALLNFQPFDKYAALRIVPEDVPTILNFKAKLMAEKRHDILYVLGNVLIKGPVEYTVREREISVEPCLWKYHDGKVNVPVRMNTAMNRNGPCVIHYKKMVKIDQRFLPIEGKIKQLDDNDIDIAKYCRKPAEAIRASCNQLFHDKTTSNPDAEEPKQEAESTPKQKPKKNRADTLQSIKQRAMTKAVNPVKHLTGIQERKAPASASSSSEQEKSEEEASKPKKRIPKVKGRGRASALKLEELFGNPPKTKATVALKNSPKGMPIIDLDESIDSETEDDSDTETLKHKPPNKNIYCYSSPVTQRLTARNKKKIQSVDSDTEDGSDTKTPKQKPPSKNISSAAKQITAKDYKRMQPGSVPIFEVFDSIDLSSAKDGTEANLNIANQLHRDDKVTKSNAKIIKDIEIATVAQQTIKSNQIEPVKTYTHKKKEVVSQEKDGTDSKDVSNTNTATKDNTNKGPKKASKINKGNLETIDKKNTKDGSKESQPTKKHLVLDRDESEMDVETSNQPELPTLSKRKRIQNYTKPSTTDEASSDCMEGNTATMKDTMTKLTTKEPKMKRGLKLRVKSSYKKLGILEVASDVDDSSSFRNRGPRTRSKKK